jgi:RNA polymerase sigma factor (sigma-70 family)
MAKGLNGSALTQLHTLFTDGTLGSLSDAQLVERFGAGGNEAAESAFAALVQRHGPMVLRVCRDVLSDEHEAEDTFQATFLLLAHKAPGLHVRDSLAPWLHAVACRVAACARSASVRRKKHERGAAEMAAQAYVDEASDDSKRLIHEAVSRLPDRFRKPIVLCYFEGLTTDQAASHLSWPVGTVRSRLARGRARLRGQLSRRGLAPSIGLAALRSAESVPECVAKATTFAAGRIVAGQSESAVIPKAVLSLVHGGLTEMTRRTLRNVAIALVLPFGILITYLGWTPIRLAGSTPTLAPVASEGMTRESVERLAPLLGTWESTQVPGRVVTIKLLRADPALARDLGFDTPFICTWTWRSTVAEPGKDHPKPSALLFVDPARDPAQVTYQPLGFSAGDSGHLDGVPGIYRVEGDLLTILDPRRTDGPRPTNFEQMGDKEKTFLQLFRRVADKRPGEENQPVKRQVPAGSEVGVRGSR